MRSIESIKGWWVGSGRGEAAYFLAFNAANALNYAYLVLMGFLLGGDSYGLFGALFGVVYLNGALANTVQVTTAKVVVEATATTGRVLPASLVVSILARAGAVAALAGLGTLAASPLLANLFHTSAGPLIWVSLGIALAVPLASMYGMLQGLQDFGWLGASVCAASAFRLIFGAALVMAGWGVTGALAAIPLSYAAAAVLVLIRLRRWLQPMEGQWPLRGAGQTLGMVLAASLASSFPTSFDVAVVKHYFPSEEAGLFTAISVLGRVVLFLPVALSFIAFPKVTAARVRGDSTRSLLLATLALVGALALGAALVLLALVSFTGFSPADVDVAEARGALGWYLMGMAFFSLVVVLIYYNLGHSNGAYVYGLLLPFLVLQAILLISLHDSLTMVAQVVFVGNGLLLLLSLGHALAPGLPRLRLRPHKVSLARGEEPLKAD